MTTQEVEIYQKRVEEFRRLQALEKQTRETLATLTEMSDGKPNAFTQNLRDSRQITKLQIEFSAARGGDPPVVMYLSDLNVDAHHVGNLLETILRNRLSEIKDLMQAV
jgi:hypothetical protein